MEVVPKPACRDGVVRYAETEIPTENGPLHVVVFRECADDQVDPSSEHIALIVGDPLSDPNDVLVRVHSECMTSEVFGSLACDCRHQFDAAMTACREKGSGIIVYLRQEGRGIGLGNKIRAYALQAKGMDTLDANQKLGFEADLRTYDIAAGMLRDLGVHGVSLMTNNPDKVLGLEEAGIKVIERISCEVAPTLHSARYLATKRTRFGHMLNLLMSPNEE